MTHLSHALILHKNRIIKEGYNAFHVFVNFANRNKIIWTCCCKKKLSLKVWNAEGELYLSLLE